MAMAMPVSDMMFDEMPNCCMSRKAVRMDSGRGRVTMTMLRKCQRKRMWARVTRITSSQRACLRVLSVRSMRSLRS